MDFISLTAADMSFFPLVLRHLYEILGVQAYALFFALRFFIFFFRLLFIVIIAFWGRLGVCSFIFPVRFLIPTAGFLAASSALPSSSRILTYLIFISPFCAGFSFISFLMSASLTTLTAGSLSSAVIFSQSAGTDGSSFRLSGSILTVGVSRFFA